MTAVHLMVAHTNEGYFFPDIRKKPENQNKIFQFAKVFGAEMRGSVFEIEKNKKPHFRLFRGVKIKQFDACAMCQNIRESLPVIGVRMIFGVK